MTQRWLPIVQQEKMLKSAVSNYIDRIVGGRGLRQRVITQPRPTTDIPPGHPKQASTGTLVLSVFYPQCPNLIFGVSSFDFWPEQNKVLQFDCIAEGVFMKEHLQKGALLVALGIVVIVGGFIFAAAVLGLWLNSIGNLAP
jgi:hypothetical protein